MQDVTADNARQDVQLRISELEQHYITLLESKIAALEAKQSDDRKSQMSDDIVNKKDKDIIITYHKRSGVASVTGIQSAENSEEDNKAKVSRGETDDSDPLAEASKPTSRYRVLISKWDEEALERVETSADIKEPVLESNHKAISDVAFTFTKIQERNGVEIAGSEVKVESAELKDILNRIVYSDDDSGDSSSYLYFNSPFTELVWAWDALESETEKSVEQETEVKKLARQDLQELMRLVMTSSGNERLSKYFKDRDSMKKDRMITFDTLWSLFPFGVTVLAKPFLGLPQVFKVAITDGFPKTDSEEPFEIKCYCMDWDGSSFSMIPFVTQIAQFDGRKSIVDLACYPLAYYQEKGKSQTEAVDGLKKTLTDRGKVYREICIRPRGQQMFQYEGIAYHRKSKSFFASRESSGYITGSSDSDTISDRHRRVSVSDKLEIKGVAMIDFASYLEYETSAAPFMGTLRRWYGGRYWSDDDEFGSEKYNSEQALSDEQFLLCPPRALGYAMSQKTWAQFDIAKLQKPKGSTKNTFEDELQLNKSLKQLIYKSVMAHETGKKKNMEGHDMGVEDFAQGKGKGLTIMLYGLPGVGKTLTAESVAMLAGKPLFSVGVADIGTEGQNVEENLQEIFDLATMWEAVLLFDEADVFLEARGLGENDLRRNAMVSVLLRVLEYYEGILILTTNRMKSFDIAVQSRIHLAIKYGDLTEDQRKNIYRSFIKQLQGKDLVGDYAGSNGIEDWIESEAYRFTFNGREIRNIISTAMGIARHDKGKLQRSHLSMVARQTDDFKRDLHTQEIKFRQLQYDVGN